MTEKFLIAIYGPTAIGKTALAINLAEYFSTEIISADSRQFYREMTVGTAVPAKEELNLVKHHFIQHISVEDEYSVGKFEQDALERLRKIFTTKNVAIMVGGSGLYMDAVSKGLDVFPEIDPHIRNSLMKELSEKGISALQEELKTRDRDYFQQVDLQNPHRLIRALEVCRGTGRPYSSFRKNAVSPRPFQTLEIGLTGNRVDIYYRINARVDQMLKNGLEKEATGLLDKRHLNALNTVGYKELFAYLDGTWTREKAVEEIKRNTRRFAKRQMTWLRRKKDLQCFEFDTPPEKIIDYVRREITHS